MDSDKGNFVTRFLKGFKEFALRGNVLDLAVGVMIGGAFSQIVSSVVNDLFMPLLGLLLGRINLAGAFIALDGKPYATATEAAAAGVGVFNYGSFITKVIDFILMALVIYGFVRLVQRFMPKRAQESKPEPAPAPRTCPFCHGELHADATRCPHCTSYLVDESISMENVDLPEDIEETLGIDAGEAAAV